jgi:hypothetical protein
MDELVKKLTDLAAQLAPQVWTVAQRAVVLDGWADVLIGVIALGVTGAMWAIAYYCHKRWIEDGTFSSDGASCAVALVCSLFPLLLALLTLGNLWTYIAIVDPAVWMAHHYINP